TNALFGVWMVDSNVATAVGDVGTILRTSDAGATWAHQTAILANFRAVSFGDADFGTAVGSSGVIIRTTNGGDSWTNQSSGTTNELFAIVSLDANVSVVVGANRTILRTDDGGSTWVPQSDDEASTTLRGVSFVDSSNGFAVGSRGIVLRTTDAGA